MLRTIKRTQWKMKLINWMKWLEILLQYCIYTYYCKIIMENFQINQKLLITKKFKFIKKEPQMKGKIKIKSFLVRKRNKVKTRPGQQCPFITDLQDQYWSNIYSSYVAILRWFFYKYGYFSAVFPLIQLSLSIYHDP